ncbi:MAG: hypothetical protein J0L53_01600 [Spirochaetes bacterium]|nr:hypothetical protein [Spirochaetota bacterium]
MVETDAGKFIVKLHGAGQGYGALIAEVVTAELAEKIGLPVPGRALVTISESLLDPREDPELLQLLRASLGYNLGFEYIAGAVTLNMENRVRIGDEAAAKVLWLDWLTENPDRTWRNPNILIRDQKFWLIDHGATLGFQYSLEHLTEDSPARRWAAAPDHVFYKARHLLPKIHAEFGPFCSYEEFLTLSWDIPREFIRPETAPRDYDLATRRRELFAAWLWKRFKSFKPDGI